MNLKKPTKPSDKTHIAIKYFRSIVNGHAMSNHLAIYGEILQKTVLDR